MNTLIIFGCGGHARSVADMALTNGFKNLLFIDENARENETLFDFKIIPALEESKDLIANYFVGIGDNHQRAALYDSLSHSKKSIATLISKNSYLGKNIKINPGTFIGQYAYIGPQVEIADNTIVNTKSIVEHDSIIGKHCHIAINSTIAGKCRIGDFVMIGAGATVIDNINICSYVTVGAGAVVIDHINESGTYVGVPARRI